MKQRDMFAIFGTSDSAEIPAAASEAAILAAQDTTPVTAAVSEPDSTVAAPAPRKPRSTAKKAAKK
jgi:hypothetical protein